MKFLLPLFTVFSMLVNGQIQSSQSTANFKKNSKGTMVLWYGYQGKATQYSAKTVSFDDSFTESEIATKLKKDVYLSGDYIGFEFLQGLGCNDTYAHLARTLKMSLSDVKDLRNGTCWDSENRYEKEPEAISEINQEAMAKLKPVLAPHETKLVSQGWKKIYEVYKNAGSGGDIRLLPGHTYTAVGVVMSNGDKDMEAAIMVDNGDKQLLGMTHYMESDLQILYVNDLQVDLSVQKGFFVVNANGKTTPGSGLMIFERIRDFKRDLLNLIEARNKGFEDYKGMTGNLTQNNEQIYYSTVTLGYDQAKIFKDQKNDTYVIVMDFDNPKTLVFVDHLQEALKDFPAKGYVANNYTNDNKGNVTEYSKNGEQVMMLITYPEKSKAYFYIYKKIN